MNLPAEFDLFLIRDAKAERFGKQFTPLMTGVTLIRDDALEQVLRRYQNAAGIYFWIMAVESAKYAIYIGQANPLSRRLRNYISDFQPHSPNDYKLQIFRAFTSELSPPGTLDLYFMPTDAGALTATETAAKRFYLPLLNDLPQPAEEARQKLREAFAEYYRSAILKKLKP
jgi:hypothetical protein